MGSIYINHSATSLSEYIDVINTINKMNQYKGRELWYRGQNNSSWRLIPSAIRAMEPYLNARGEKITTPSISYGDTYRGPSIAAMMNVFQRKAYPYLTDVPSNEFEWLFLAQHHGLPTRLLDWTLNPLVALYFALENKTASSDQDSENESEDMMEEFLNNNEFRSDGVAVFIMDPVEINNIFHDINKIVDIAAESESWKNYSEFNSKMEFEPICVLGNFRYDRIRFQSGNFTLHGSNIWSLDYYTVTEQKFHKIFIHNSYVKEIFTELRRMGINKNFIYPGLDSLAFDIKMKEFERFNLRFESNSSVLK